MNTKTAVEAASQPATHAYHSHFSPSFLHCRYRQRRARVITKRRRHTCAIQRYIERFFFLYVHLDLVFKTHVCSDYSNEGEEKQQNCYHHISHLAAIHICVYRVLAVIVCAYLGHTHRQPLSHSLTHSHRIARVQSSSRYHRFYCIRKCTCVRLQPQRHSTT